MSLLKFIHCHFPSSYKAAEMDFGKWSHVLEPSVTLLRSLKCFMWRHEHPFFTLDCGELSKILSVRTNYTSDIADVVLYTESLFWLTNLTFIWCVFNMIRRQKSAKQYRSFPRWPPGNWGRQPSATINPPHPFLCFYQQMLAVLGPKYVLPFIVQWFISTCFCHLIQNDYLNTKGRGSWLFFLKIGKSNGESDFCFFFLNPSIRNN